jgi:hypothetical protein
MGGLGMQPEAGWSGLSLTKGGTLGLFNLVSFVQRFFFHTHRAGVKVKGV